MQRAWFRCPRCQGDWEVRITNDRVTVLPTVERSIAFREDKSSKPSRVVAFDVDPASLASLREALPGWEIEAINGATPESLTSYWHPGRAGLLVVHARGNTVATLGLCRFLSLCSDSPTEDRNEESRAPGSQDNLPAFWPNVPLLILAPRGQEDLVGAALTLGAHSCLLLPIHPKEVASMLVHARAGNQPGRHTLNLERAQSEDRWRDDGGQG